MTLESEVGKHGYVILCNSITEEPLTSQGLRLLCCDCWQSSLSHFPICTRGQNQFCAVVLKPFMRFWIIITSPLPSRAPVLGSTATEPMTRRSTLIFSSNPIGRPYLATPTEVQASFIVLGVNNWDSSTEKNPVRKRGWGVNNFFPPAQDQRLKLDLKASNSGITSSWRPLKQVTSFQ